MDWGEGYRDNYLLFAICWCAVSRPLYMSSLVKLLSIVFLNLKSQFTEFTTDGCEQEEVQEEVEHDPVGSGLSFSRSVRPHASETRDRLVDLGVFQNLREQGPVGIEM